jgi:hypothetical protein
MERQKELISEECKGRKDFEKDELTFASLPRRRFFAPFVFFCG